MGTLILILSILALLQFILNCSFGALYFKTLKEKNSYKQEIEGILPGDKVYFEMNLQWDTKKFTACYEADVIEASDKGVKVQAYKVVNLTGDTTDLKKDPNYNLILLNYMKDKWVEKKDVSVLIGKEHSRERKLNKLLS